MNINFNDVDYVKHNNLDINAVKLNGEEIWRVGTTVNGVPPLTLSNAANAKLKKYKIYGNSVQDGTPTPDSPVEIQSVGDLSTKNLLSIKDMYSTPYSGYGLTISQVDDDTLEINGEFTGSNYVSVFAKRLIVPIAVDTTKKYSITCKYISGTTSNPNNEYNFVYFNKANDVSGNGESNWNTISIDNKDTVKNNISIDKKYIYSMRLVIGVGVIYENYRFQLQIKEGTTTTDEYEPYNKYKIPVVARGRNLIKLNKLSHSANGGTITNNQDGTYTLSGTPTGYCGLRIGNIPKSLLDVLRNNVCVLTGFYYYEKNVRITLNVKLNGSYIKYIYLNPYTYKNYVQVDLRTTEFDEITFALSNQKDNVDFENVTVKPLLEVGTTMPTSFEPYIAPVTTNIFLDEPLRKVGDYADYVDFEKQKVVRNIKRKNFDGREGWAASTIKEITNVYKLPFGANDAGSRVCISNRFIDSAEGDVEKIVIGADYFIYIAINKTTAAGLSSFNTWLANNPTYIVYELATPIEETVNLPALPQFKGTTIYEVGTTIRPSNMSVTYIKK